MRPSTSSRLAAATLAATVGFVAPASADNKQVTIVGGYTGDAIVENAGDPTYAPSAVTPGQIFGTNSFALYQAGTPNISNNAGTTAVPANTGLRPSGRYVVPVDGELVRVQLPAYTADNVARMTAASPATTLQFAADAQTAYRRVWLVANGDSGSPTVSITYNFAGGSNETVAGVTVPDWFNTGTGQFAVGAGRVGDPFGSATAPTFSGTDTTGASGARLFALPVTISAANQNKVVQSVTVTRTGGTSANSAAMAFGLVGDPTASGRLLTQGATAVGVQVTGGAIAVAAAGTSGNAYPAAESPDKVVDGSTATKYLNFGKLNTGVVLTPAGNPGDRSIVTSLSVMAANDTPARDPIDYVLMGSKVAGSTTFGDYTTIASGTLDLPTDRFTWSDAAFANSQQYASYLVYFPNVRDASTNSMQVSEIQLFGTAVVPEPSAAAALLFPAGLLLARRRRRAAR
ncbi:MAG TPA: PEP-CTERM sorting domain-containing protein [Humisphaera sp.]